MVEASKQTQTQAVQSKTDFLELLPQVRPALHRYCTRLAGSVFDGEDLTQLVLEKALFKLSENLPIDNLQGWLFRIAHNALIDNYRAAKSRPEGHLLDKEQEEISSRPAALDDLDWLMSLPPLQRSVLVLSNGFGYSAKQSAEILHTTEASIKSALNRAREHLKQYQPTKTVGDLNEDDCKRLRLYSELFNDRKFDALLELTIDEIKLDMVAKAQLAGRKDIEFYFGNYDSLTTWHVEPGIVDGKPAVLVFEPAISVKKPQYIILLEFEADALKRIQDFRYARYVMDSAKWQSVATN
ncbi:RNA polymerase sigma factor [Aliikangiella sp. G2MR2-5]|uniref:RNA polymerase sigma factor n=1 Tax=Aliikangiella sp. G2MR2-5 TaxID=2788943 RepID=UPI0018ABD328|nr:RNA polymerase sigma factor [Aliikangiella sp. G2MR2-5]